MSTACHRCGAPLGAVPALYCRSCGARQALGVDDLEAYRRNPERYELVAQHPAYPAAMRWSPRLSATTELLPPLLMFAWFVLFALMVWGLYVAKLRFPLWFVAAVIAMTVVALGPVVTAAARLWAPSSKLVAVVAEDVTRPSRGGDPAGVADHQVMLRTADGRGLEVLATGAVMGLVALADIGVAYVQGRRLVDFRVFDVMPPPRAPGQPCAPARPPACTVCAAPYTFAARARCGFCDAPLAAPDLGEHGARFAAVLADPATRAALARPSDGVLPSSTRALVALAIAGFLAYGLWTLAFLWFFLAERVPVALLVLLPPVGFICFAVIYARRRLGPQLRRPLIAVALVVRERESSWASVNGVPVIERHVTLAGPGGGRLERRALELIADRCEPGQIGVACIRGPWLAGFTVLSAATARSTTDDGAS